MYKLGFMQGRLIKSERKNFVQSFPWKNWKKEIQIANKNNLRIIEWTLDYYKFNQNPLIDKKKSNDLKKYLLQNNVRVTSVTSDFYMQMPIVKQKSQYLKKICSDNMTKLINSCNYLKIKNIIIPLVDNSSLKNLQDEMETVNFFLQFEKILKKTKIKILFEIDYNPRKVLTFINKFSNNFGINYDTGNSASLGFNIDKEIIYFDRVHNIHIKDRLYKGITVKLGKGDFNFRKFFTKLKKIKYKKNLIFQTAKTWKNNEIGEVLDNIKFIKKFI